MSKTTLKVIYQITNIKNNKIYIGSSSDFSSRKRKHLSELRRGLHGNVHLQSAWDYYGEENFEFSILEEVGSDEDLLIREQHYFTITACLDREYGYNISQYAGAPMKNRKHTKESIEKMRASKMEDKNNFYGRSHSEETKSILRAQRVGRRLSDEHREKVLRTAAKGGEDNINAKLTWDKVREIREKYLQTERKYGIIKKLTEEYGVHRDTIAGILKNKTWKEE